MSKLERITVTMPAEMAAKLRAAVDEGSYATSSEIVREAVRAWVDKEERRQAELTRIRALIAEGEASEMLDRNPTKPHEAPDRFGSGARLAPDRGAHRSR
jgi:antitoxin ParD1/3/4